MPVTAKLSKAFYERLGEQIANELVDWFNAVDATYRNDLRELNEANFARFDAKLEQRITELRSELLAEFRTGLTNLEARLERRIARSHADFIKWSFGSCHRRDRGIAVVSGERTVNRVLYVTRDGKITEFRAFGNIVPTGLDVSGNEVYMAQAGAIPHLPEDRKVVAGRFA